MKLANEFVEKIPAATFSMAQLQAFLMAHRNNASSAIQNIAKLGTQ